jgi:plastocyanin
MKSRSKNRVFFSLVWTLVGCVVIVAAPVRAAVAHVNIIDNAFSPSNIVVSVNDDVAWAWVGVNLHSTTSTTGLWDAGLHTTGFNFSHTFTSAGNFPYFCSNHFFKGNVTVQAQTTTNVPPITLFSALRPTASSFQLNYTATTGLVYVVEASTNLFNWTPLSTNTAATTSVTFSNNNATALANFYRVRLLPNP